jgi:hypothetical protein
MHTRLLIGALGAALLLHSVEVSTGQAKPGASAPDGLVRTELSLTGHTVTIAFSPLKPDASRVRVAQLHTNGSLRIGTLALGKEVPAGLDYDLWLEAAGENWSLQATEASTATGAAPATTVGQLLLPRRSSTTGSSTFVAALAPSTGDTGRLVLRWGADEAETAVQFTDPPRRTRQTETALPNVTTNRTHDEDTSALSRARLLAQRNETAMGLADGSRLSVSFARFFTRQERPGTAPLGLGVEGPDFARLASTADGAVVQLTESAVPRLRIEVPLRFGRTVVPIGNQGRGFPGSYGIWLKRVGNGWRLVLNHEADAWGSQHDPRHDAAEIQLTHSDTHPASRPFAVALIPTAADRGSLVVLWGPHEWTADFIVN